MSRRTLLLPALFLSCALATFASLPAVADGCYFSPEQQDLLEPTQIGLVVHDGAREDLYLQVDFTEASGAAVERMGWILALPSVPVVGEADERLFVAEERDQEVDGFQFAVVQARDDVLRPLERFLCFDGESVEVWHTNFIRAKREYKTPYPTVSVYTNSTAAARNWQAPLASANPVRSATVVLCWRLYTTGRSRKP